ncbi:sugar transporter [Collybia nuda]|uniref:Sugar transporter n=1 Tax=Collybia nuda TaxID=64659 RepID=A0A9P6CCG7_9AGAR|nr:sugar transporter [Collybia nuda]
MASTIQETPSTSTLEKRNGSDDLAGDIEDPESRKVLERKLVRKIDLRISILVVIYILNFIDRSNAASARLRGFEEDLGLHGNQFATILAIYFVGYILMQVPSNMLLSYVKKPSWHLPGSMVIWGLISILTGVTKDFTGVLLCRFFLGFVEAAFFPGALLLLSRWYKREEMGLRTAILFCGLLVSLAFGSLIASGILDTMQGKLGYAAWRWLYFIEGAITIAVAIIAIFILPDFPENSSSWLSPAEQALAIQRMREDARHNLQGEHISEWVGFKMAISDWKIWWLSMTYAAIFLSISFNAYFPTLTATLGYNTTISLLLVAPPPIFISIVSFFYARHSDRTRERFWHIAFAFAVGIAGYIIVISTMNRGARYAGLFLVSCVSAGYIVFLAWISNSIPEPPAKRAVGLAFMSAFAQLGAIGGSYIFPKNWGPTYRISFGISLGASGLVIVMCYIFKLHLESLNRKAQQEEEARGQKEPGFRYLV